MAEFEEKTFLNAEAAQLYVHRPPYPGSTTIRIEIGQGRLDKLYSA